MKNLFIVFLIFCVSVFPAGSRAPSMDKFKEGSKKLFEFPKKVIIKDEKAEIQVDFLSYKSK